MGAMDLPKLLPVKWAALAKPPLVAAVALMMNVFDYLPGVSPAGLASYMSAFMHDDRSEMLAWIRTNVPADAVIAAEPRADLPVPRRPERLAVRPLLPQRVIETKYAADLGDTPEALAAKRIDYIVISESDYGIFRRKAAKTHLTPEMQRKSEFYEVLFREYQPVWQRARGTGIYLHPGLQVYRLTASGKQRGG
jgi:hypothetical protein